MDPAAVENQEIATCACTPTSPPHPANGRITAAYRSGPRLRRQMARRMAPLDAVIETTTKSAVRGRSTTRKHRQRRAQPRLNQLVNDLDLNVTLEDTAFTPTWMHSAPSSTRWVPHQITNVPPTPGPHIVRAPPELTRLWLRRRNGRGATEGTHRPDLRTHIATSAPIKNADAAAFRACAAAAENYGTDEQGRAHRVNDSKAP